MKLQDYVRLRPCLWHLTTRQNWISIRKRADGGDYVLSSAATLHGQAQEPEFELAAARTEAASLTLPWGEASIRSQERLARAEERLEFPDEWNLGRYCEWLNGFVFFWPGTPDGPSTPAGKKYFKYHIGNSEEKLTFLKVDADRVISRLEGTVLFSAAHTGAPSGRKKVVERSADVFVSAGEINVPSDVIEVAFPDELTLSPEEITPVAESRMKEHLGIKAE